MGDVFPHFLPRAKRTTAPASWNMFIMSGYLRKYFIIGRMVSVLAACFSAINAHGASAPLISLYSRVTEGISSPVRIATDPMGNFYVTDPRGGGVLKYSSSGKLLKIMPTARPPQGVAIHADGNLIVSQGGFAAILDRDSGAEITRLGGPGRFKMANGIAVDAAGYIYVVDSLDNCIQVFNSAGSPVTMGAAAPGKPINSFGSFGNGDGQFAMPTGIAFERVSGQLAVADTRNGRIQFFTNTGLHQKTIGAFGSGPLRFTTPQGVVFEYSKSSPPAMTRMYVVDSFQSLVQAVDPTGAGMFLGSIGGYGFADGRLTNPSDAVMDQFDPLNNRLVVVNGRGNLTIYGIDGGIITAPPVAGPALTLDQLPSFTNLTNLTVSGTVGAGATVKVNNLPATVSGGVWSLDITLVTGANGISVVAADTAGNTTVKTAVVTVDPLATQLTVNPVATPTKTASQIIAGVTEAGASVKVNGNGATVSGTSWSYTANLVEGINHFTITATITGKKDSTENVGISRQSTSPAITLSALSNGSIAASQIQNVTGLVNSADLSSVTVNGRPVAVTNGLFTVPITLINGANTITVTATDAAGNSTTATRTINFDATRHAATIAASPDNIVTGTNTATIYGTAAGAATLTVNGTPALTDANGAWSATVNLAPGLNTFEITATDRGGKTSSAKRTITFDPGRPALATATPPQDLATNASRLTVTGTASGNEVTVTAAINGTNVPIGFKNGIYSLTADFLTEGAYTIAVTAADAAGGVTTDVRTVMFDVTQPQLTVDTSPSPQPASMSGTVEAGATLTVRDKNGPVGRVTIGSDGKWSVDLAGTGYDPATLSITAIDAAGNSSRNGDVDGNGKVDIADALKALRISVGLDTPTFGNLLRGDVAPLRSHLPVPDGRIDIEDVILIMRRVVGLPW